MTEIIFAVLEKLYIVWGLGKNSIQKLIDITLKDHDPLLCIYLTTLSLTVFFLKTSGAFLWLLYDLARNPKVQEKVYEEVLSLIGPHGDFTPENFAKLEYIKACVKESMR